jgi:hypothetical protein
MKIKRAGKEYEYDYMTMYMPGDLHRRLKNLSKTEKVTLVKMLDKVLKKYEDIHNTGI